MDLPPKYLWSVVCRTRDDKHLPWTGDSTVWVVAHDRKTAERAVFNRCREAVASTNQLEVDEIAEEVIRVETP